MADPTGMRRRERHSGGDSRGVRVRWYWLKQPERSVCLLRFVLLIMSTASCYLRKWRYPVEQSAAISLGLVGWAARVTIDLELQIQSGFVMYRYVTMYKNIFRPGYPSVVSSTARMFHEEIA